VLTVAGLVTALSPPHFYLVLAISVFSLARTCTHALSPIVPEIEVKPMYRTWSESQSTKFSTDERYSILSSLRVVLC